jgi:glycosyltransferase involved in cell wall biosynthesis
VRILLATDNYPPFIGGAQIQSRVLARELRDRGHKVVVATIWQNDMPALEDDKGISVHRLRQLRTIPGFARRRRQHHQPPFPDPVTSFELRRLIRRFRPDIVHSYGWISYSCAAALLGKNIPLLITARDYAYSCANRTLMRDGELCSGPAPLKCLACAGRYYGRPKGWLAALGVLSSKPLLMRKVRAVHSVSSYVEAIMRRDLPDDGDMTPRQVIHDAVRLPLETRGGARVDEADSALEKLPEGPFMLFVGALRRVKGVEELLTAYELLEDPPPLVIIGTLERDSPTDFPAGVRVLTDVPHDAVMSAYERCMFSVMPSRWPEPFGTVVGEAMSRGKPVIGTNPGGHTDLIVHGETGLLVNSGDVPALAHAMQVLISDPEMRERLGRAAAQRARLFTAEVTIPRIEALYERLINQSAAPLTQPDELPQMRLLFVTDTFPPFIGGAQRQLRTLGQELYARGHSVTVATAWQVGMPTIEDDEGVVVHRLRQLRTAIPRLNRDPRQRHQPPFPDPVLVYGLRKLINRTRPDLIYSYGWSTFSCATALIGKDIPLMASARDYGYFCATRTMLFRGRTCTGPAPVKCLGCAGRYYGVPKGWAAALGVYVSRQILRHKLSALQSVSTYMQEVMRRELLNGQESVDGSTGVVQVVIPSFLTDERAAQGEEDAEVNRYLQRLPSEPFILFVGALRKVKGVETLLEAYSRLTSPPPLVLMGTLERDTPGVFPPGVVLLTDVPHAAVMAAWRRALFGVAPSLWPEPSGGVLVEALSSGKAMIGTRPGGQSDAIIDGSTGLLVPAGDIGALASAMDELIRDPARREELGRAALEHSRQFTTDLTVSMFERTFEALVQGKPLQGELALGARR